MAALHFILREEYIVMFTSDYHCLCRPSCRIYKFEEPKFWHIFDVFGTFYTISTVSTAV